MFSNGEHKMMNIARAPPPPSTISIVKLELINPDDEVNLINLEYFDHSSVIHKNLEAEPEDVNGNEDPLCASESNAQQFQDDTPIEVKSDSTINEETRKNLMIPKRTSQKRQPHYACRFYQLIFTTKIKYEDHFRIHTDTGEKPYKCETCDSSFTRNSALDAHNYKCEQLFHQDTPIEVKSDSTISEGTRKRCVIPKKCTSQKPHYACRFCQLNFSSKLRYQDHFRKIHADTGEKPYKCETCDSSFTRNTALDAHKYKCDPHFVERPSRPSWNCGPCGLGFRTKSSFMAHKETPHHHMHTEQKPYNCDICGISFASKSTLEAHERIHSGEKPFKCDICGICFPGELSLDVHKLNHSGAKPFKCDIENCGMSFSFVSRLIDHKRMISHSSISYKCNDCGMYFRGANNFKTHQVTHTAKNPQ